MSVPLSKFGNLLKKHLRMSGVQNERNIRYKVEELKDLCAAAVEVLKSEPMLGQMNPPCVIVGDVHGQYFDLLRMFSLFNSGKSHGSLCNKYVFLGDYVDRGRRSLECIVLLLLLKVSFPKKFILLRGNHECRPINQVYGFYDEILDRFDNDAEVLYSKFNEVFNWMPLAGLVGKRILCMHGGISKGLKSLDLIEKIPRPLEDPSVNALAMDLMWADPMVGLRGFCANGVRGVASYFGEDAVKDACTTLGLDMIVRGHQMMMNGYGFFANRKLCTIFTAPKYQADSNNSGAVLFINTAGKIGFKVLSPDEDDEEVEAETVTAPPTSIKTSTSAPSIQPKKKRTANLRKFQSASCFTTQQEK